MDGGSCHWEPVPREGKFLQPVESPAEPHPFTNCSWAAWDFCLQGGFIELAERLVVLISLFSLSLSQCFLLCGSSPRGSKHRADPDQQHSPGQFFLLCFPLSRRDSTQIRAAACSSFHLLSFPFYSPSLPFCSPPRTKLLSPPCARSQLLNTLFQVLPGQESFITLPCFAFMLWSARFAPSGSLWHLQE